MEKKGFLKLKGLIIPYYLQIIKVKYVSEEKELFNFEVGGKIITEVDVEKLKSAKSEKDLEKILKPFEEEIIKLSFENGKNGLYYYNCSVKDFATRVYCNIYSYYEHPKKKIEEKFVNFADPIRSHTKTYVDLKTRLIILERKAWWDIQVIGCVHESVDLETLECKKIYMDQFPNGEWSVKEYTCNR